MSKANSQELNRAIQAYQRGDLSGAAATCRAYLDAKPSAAGAWHLLGLISFQEKDFEHAERYLMRAVNLKPDAWSFHLNLGAVRAAAGRPHQALLAYRAAATLKPRSPDAHYNLGNALLDLGREADAEVAYKTAVDLSPDDADLWAKLATAQSRIHKAEAACRSAREALDLKPEHTTARETLARALVERCEAEAAESELRRLQKDPAHGPESTDLLGRIVLTRGNFSEGWRLRAEAFEDLVTAAGLNTLWDGGSAPESIWIEGSSEIAENVTLAQLIPHSPLADAHVHLRCPEACHAAINHLVPGLSLHGEDAELATDMPLTALTSLPALMKLDESASAALLTPATDGEAMKGESIGICLDTAGNSSLMA
ncbi:MAG: tetratricopeptide repeat protein, partial [Gammaproteobacteria bacterium]